MKNTKKYLFGLTCSTLLLMGIVTVFANNRLTNIDTTFSGLKHSYATTPDNENYAGYHRITTKDTLLPGVNVVIVKYDESESKYYASNTLLDGSQRLTSTEVTLTNGGFAHNDPFTYNVNAVDSPCFLKGTSQLVPYSTSSNQFTWNASANNKMTIGLSEGSVRVRFPLSPTKKIGWNSEDHVFVIIDNSDTYNLQLFVEVDSVVQAWATTYLHMDLDVDNQCLTYTAPARNALLAMDSYVIADLYYNASFKEYKDRYEAWCAHQELDPYNE